MAYSTEQENFWAGEFGDSYVDRSSDSSFIASDIALFARVLRRTSGITSALEFGANVGLNLIALRNLHPQIALSAIEINSRAVLALNKIPNVEVFEQSLLTFEPSRKWDFVFTKGVLIHLAPSSLERAYKALFESSCRYICVAEYYNPAPVEVSYRGNEERLFKRDFAGELMERFTSLKLVDYGFVYRRDNNFRQDDLTWFLLEKSPG